MSTPRADKRFGQHYLANEGVVSRIVDAVERYARRDNRTRPVLEIGPGPGALTRGLLARGLKVVALELDERMVPVLEEAFAAERAEGRFDLIRGDAMRFSLDEIQARLGGDEAVVCGNLPYNVGSQIVFRFFEEASFARYFCYMLQKEVVLKFISGQAGMDSERRDYGPPGIKLRWGTRPGGHFWVSPGSFRPPPKVDSGVFWFERLPREESLAWALERGGDYDRAGEWVARAFQNRRKMLKGTFKDLATHPDGTRRVEELDPVKLLQLALGRS